MYRMLVFCVMATLAKAQPSTDLLMGKDPSVNGLLPEVETAFKKMRTAAAEAGIQLKNASGYRSYGRQRQIWNAKYRRYKAQGLGADAVFDKITEYSTLPGTSRHHWGTDLDLIDGSKKAGGDLLETEKFYGDGPFCDLRVWLENHAADYGFYPAYTDDPERPGFKYEPWHYSYAPVARQYYRAFMEKVGPSDILSDKDLIGGKDISLEKALKYFRSHVSGINARLK